MLAYLLFNKYICFPDINLFYMLISPGSIFSLTNVLLQLLFLGMFLKTVFFF